MTDLNIYKQKLQKNIWKFYLYNMLTGMFFAVPVFVLFWQENGLNLTEIMLLQSIFALSTVILEVPTGYFADIHGRKSTMIIAGITGLLAISIYSIGHNFFQFLIAEIFFALSISFSSGTKSALVYDTLKELGKEKQYKKLWGNLLFYGMMSLAVSSIIGGFIGKINLRYTLYASIPFFALPVLITLSMKEPQRHKLVIQKGYTKELLNILKTTFIHNKKLRWIIIYSGVVYAFNQAALWLYQPYFILSGLDIAWFGFVFSSFQLVAAFTSKYAHKLEEKLGQKYSLAMLILLVAFSYFLMSNFVFLFSFSFCFIQQFVRGFKNAIVTDYINQLTVSEIRATVLSAQSFIGRLIYAIIIPFIGWVADVYTLVQALTILAVTTLTSGIVILIILRKDRVI
ncbi:MAG: MFS transporter [Spirochaetales bacterium]|nr:MFS transporter [Spirochaetales bacterium]